VAVDHESVDTRVIDFCAENLILSSKEHRKSRTDESNQEQQHHQKDETSLLNHFQTASKIACRLQVGMWNIGQISRFQILRKVAFTKQPPEY
jgi:hypothetical protein